MDDLLYTPEEIATKLRITKQTVYDMIKRGDLDAHRIGKHLRISSAQYERYMMCVNGSENTYDAFIVNENQETLARVEIVKIYCNTHLSGQVRISIRPEDIILSKNTIISSARNMHLGAVTAIHIDHESAKVTLDIGIPLTAWITQRSLNEMGIVEGAAVYAVFKAMAVKVFKR